MEYDRQNVAVYGDLTALYSARTLLNKQIDYNLLDKVLKSIAGIEQCDSFDMNSFYTLFSDRNEKQVELIQSLQDMEWNVSTANPKHVCRGRTTDHRFDNDISYDLGLGIEEFNKVIILSDSFNLYHILERLHNDDFNCEVNLVFFSDALDFRWWKVLGEKNSWLRFIDLNSEL